jgi:hypothetical protein
MKRAALALLLAVALVGGIVPASATAAGRATIAGHVSGAGKACFTNTQPCKKAPVELYALNGAKPVATTETDSKGNYELVVPYGTYQLRLGGGSYAYIWYGGSTNRADSIPLVITSAQNRYTANAALNAEYVFSGRVNGAQGKDLRVQLYRPDGRIVDAYRLIFEDWVEHKQFYVGNVNPGSYKVRFAIVGADGQEIWSQWWRFQSGATTANVVEVNDGPYNGWVDAVYDEPGSVSGTVTGETSASFLGIPVPGLGPLKNSLVSLVHWYSGAVVDTVVTDKAGRYTFPKVVPGAYTLFFWGQRKNVDEWWNDKVAFEDTNSFQVDRAQAVTKMDARLSVSADGHAISSSVPTVLGVAQTGQTLSAVAGTWGPNVSAVSYRWSADRVTIPGATFASLVLTDAQLGKHISVTVTAAKQGYTTVSRTSAPTGEVTLGLFLPVPRPEITGDALVGATLTAVPGPWGPEPVELAYQWNADGFPIEAATATTYMPTAEDSGTALTVTVTASKPGFRTEVSRSDATKTVRTLEFDPKPVPTITGAAEVAGVLHVETGVWGPEPVTLAIQWNVDGRVVPGANAADYSPTDTDAGKVVTVTVTATKPGYVTTAQTSEPTMPVHINALSPAPNPTISGDASYGSALTATPGTWGPEPVNRTYQWNADGTGIPGQNGRTYLVGEAAIGKVITVTVTGSKPGYTTVSRTSAATRSIPGFTNRVKPEVFGEPQVGFQLVATVTDWTPMAQDYTWQWFRDGTPIAGATMNTYDVQPGDAGGHLVARVTAIAAGLPPMSRDSDPTGRVRP